MGAFPLQHTADIPSPSPAVDCPPPAHNRPHISLHTREREGKGYTLLVRNLGLGRPDPLRTVSTPPDSPSRLRAYSMGIDGSPRLHDSGAMTPPSTPTREAHGKLGSSSSLRDSFDSLRRGNSISYGHRPSIDEKEKPGSTEPRVFPHWSTDYDIEVDHKGRKKPLGSGAWSKVYRATPCLPKLDGLAPMSLTSGVDMTPPVTPVRSRDTSLSKTDVPHMPSAYAIKEPSGRTAQRVLGGECRILSYLSRFPDAEKYIVPFYGQDMRTESLVLGLMDGTLEDWIQKEMNELPEESRATKLAEVFPILASQLLDGFLWITQKRCTHGDLKPANILVSSSPTTPTSPPHAVFTDFSSSILTTSLDPSKKPVGGGTYDYLDPTLMTKASATTLPTPETDLWGLAITLLVVVLGASPYHRVASSEVMKREIIKQGDPLAWLGQGDNGGRNMLRLRALEKALAWDVTRWFRAVLVKDVSGRVGAGEWRDQLEQGVGKKGSKM